MRALNLLDGRTAKLTDVGHLIGAVSVSADVVCAAGQVALFINKKDGTSAYLTDRRSAMAGMAATSNTWVHLGGSEYFRTISYAVEGAVGGSVRIQKTLDAGESWIDGSLVFDSAQHTLYEYGGWYDAASDRGFVPCLVGTDKNKFSLVLYVYTARMTQLSSQVMLHDASVSAWYRMTEGRLISLSSGTLILPVYSSNDLFTAMDSPSGAFRCPANADPAISSSWSYINGSGCGSERGMIECQAVEMPDGNVLIEANTRTGYLVQQIWTNDGLTAVASAATSFASPRTKSDVIRLSCGGYAKLWCSAVPSGDKEGPRINAMLAFSDDLITWRDFHIVATGVFIYELYLQEVSGTLHLRYWDWPAPGVGHGIAYDKYFDLSARQTDPGKRAVPSTVRAAPDDFTVSMFAVLKPAIADIEGFQITGKPKSKALWFGAGPPLVASEDGSFRVVLPGGDVACF